MSEIKCDGKICGSGKHAGGKSYLCPHNNLFVLYPELCEEWDHEKNDKSPSEYLSQSNKKVFWICKINHCSWGAKIYSRVNGSKCTNRCREDITEEARRCTK